MLVVRTIASSVCVVFAGLVFPASGGAEAEAGEQVAGVSSS